MNARAELRDFLDHNFFKRGAFLTSFDRQTVVLGRGGEIRHINPSEKIENTFFLKDFFEDKFLGYTPAETITVAFEDLASIAQEWGSKIQVTESMNEDALYAQDFQNLKNAFGADLKKVVLVSREEFKVSDSLEAKKTFFFKAVSFGTGYPSGVWFDQYGVVGSTPEVLFSVENHHMKTVALAGTMAKGLEEELLNSEKDRAEHDFVISDIVEKLSAFGKNGRVSETHLHPYKNIVHLKTDIEIEVQGVSSLDLASALSPTAALGGYPKQSSLRFLKNSEYNKRHPNRYFGSAFGYSSETLNQAVVMIRTIQWTADTFIIESGGGVVAESVLEKELEEIGLKRQSIKGHYL